MSVDANLSPKESTSQSTIDVAKEWETIIKATKPNLDQSTKSHAKNQTKQSNTENQKNQSNTEDHVTPTMVFSVIGDSDSFVPRPWPTTLFQTALIEAAKSGGETWILFRENDEVVSKVIQEAYQHYEAMEFGRNKNETMKDNPNRHIKLINISGKQQDGYSENNSQVVHISIGEDENQLLEFEKYISKQEVLFFNPKMNIKMPVPIAIIVCEGDLRTVVHIAEALKKKIPVIIMKGSGKAADLVLDYIDNNDEFRKKASISFGIQFDNDKYELLETHLKEIIKHKDLVGVFDLDRDDPLKLSNIVGETVVSCWSIKHVNLSQKNAQDNKKTEEEKTSKKNSQSAPEYGPPLKGLSLTLKFLQNNSVSPQADMLEGFKSRTHVLNPKYSTPTSLPLYFYFAYQILQESEKLKKLGPTLLLEALKANRCDYVRVLLAKGVKFEKNDLPELYRLTVACQGCKVDPPCLHIQWILKQLDKEETEIIFVNTTGKEEVADAAKALCRTILRYKKCTQCGNGF